DRVFIAVGVDSGSACENLFSPCWALRYHRVLRHMLAATNLTKKYGTTTALDSLNLNIAAGEIFCLLGANGAGKTTTINLFLNFISPTSGHATINGLDVAEHSLETKRFLAYIPEQVNLYRNLSGLENLEYFTALASVEKYS